MATISKVVPTGDTNGRAFKVVAAATPGTLFHTAHPTALDEVTMYITNTDTVDRTATIEFGGTTAPDNQIRVLVPAGDTILAVPGIPLTNSLAVGVFGSAANVLTMSGYINRIS